MHYFDGNFKQCVWATNSKWIFILSSFVFEISVHDRFEQKEHSIDWIIIHFQNREIHIDKNIFDAENYNYNNEWINRRKWLHIISIFYMWSLAFLWGDEWECRL